MATGTTSSNVVGVHYRVGKKIGEGSFGVIFEGTNLLNNQQVAIKFEPRKSDAPQLRDEYRTYKILVGCREYPSPYWHGLGQLRLRSTQDTQGEGIWRRPASLCCTQAYAILPSHD
jgi:serine/threonine protein kinase